MKYKKVGARLLSALMTLTLVLGLLPATALAAGSNSRAYDVSYDSFNKPVVTVTAESNGDLPEDATFSASNIYYYTDFEAAYDIYPFDEATEEQSNQYDAVKALLEEKYDGDISGKIQLVNVNQTAGADFPADTTFNVSAISVMNTNTIVTKAYVYDGDKLEETDVAYKEAESISDYPRATVNVNSLQPIVFVDTTNLTEKANSKTYDVSYDSFNKPVVTVTAESNGDLPEDATFSASNIYYYTDFEAAYDIYPFDEATEEQSNQYDAVKALLEEKYDGDISGKIQLVNVNQTAGADFPADTTFNVSAISVMNTNTIVTKAYVYDGNKLEETEVTYKEAESISDYPRATVNINSLQPIVFVDTTNLTEKNGNDDNNTGLKPGAYTVTANMYVDGSDNEVLQGVTAYLTNPNVPPLEPMKNNAKLYVTEDHQVELTIKNLNKVFTLQKINDIEGKVEIEDRIMEEGDFVKYNSRISGLVMKLKDLSGQYKFEDCTEYPVILEADKHMPICLSVDFSSMKPGFDDKVENIASKEFSFAGGKAVVSTSESTLASALKNLQFTVENAENTQALKNAVETLYSADKKYKVYNPQFTNADESISLTGNSQIAYTIQTNYENAKVFVLNNGELEELDSVCLNGQIVFSDTKDEPFAVINNALSGKTAAIEYKSDSISYGYYMLTDDKYTENSLSGNTALEPQIKDTENGTEYYIGFRESLSQGAFSAFLSERSDVKVTIPYDKSKKIYLVRKVKEKKNAYVESTGSYDTVTEVDTDNAQIADGKITFTLLERNVTSNAVGSMVMDALYNGLNDKTDSIATAYILVSDKKLASMPENRKKEEGFISTPYYNGQTITLPTGAHYRLTAGTDSALDAGEYTCTTVPEDGYTWLDGSANPVTINWKIEKKYLKCKYVDETIKKGQTPAAKIEYTGFVNGETVETAKNFVAPTVTIPDNLEVGKDYKIKPTGGSADNYSLGYEEGTLKVRDSNSGTNTDKDKTQTVTANLYMDGKYNTVIPGVTVYMNNPNNPIEGTGTPTVPQANNATLVTKSDGTKLLTMDIENHVFTLQSIDGCKNAEVKSTEKSSNLVYNTTKDHNRSTRISRITFQLNDNSGVYEFTNCEEFPTIFNPENNWDNPLVLKVKFDGGKDSTLDSNKNVDTSGIGGGGGSKETTADITVKVSGDTATVSKINTKDVSEKNDLVLNVTDGAKDVTGAKLPVSDLKTIADAKVPNTTVKLSDASASLDLNALKAALKAAKGSTLDIRVLTGAAAEKKLSDAQKSALGDAKNGAAVYVEISSNGKAITDLATGKLTVTAPYKWDGKGSVQAWQMDENGKLTSVPVSYKDNVATLTLTAPGAILLGTTDAQVDTPAETKTFADVPANAYYKKAVDWAVENGITSGTSETTFAPDATCTRAQTVTFLWRAAGSPEPTKQDNPFTDVKADAYYYKAVLWAVEKGITSGTTATTFAPDATVSRAQVVSFQYRLAGAPKVEGTNVFTDVPANAYYRDAVLWAAQNGITSGTTATTFAPNAGCTRSQIVTFLYRQLANK